MSAAPFKDLDTDALWRLFDNQCDAVLRLAGMTDTELRTCEGDKNSPLSSIGATTHFFQVIALELERRGELPEGWLASA